MQPRNTAIASLSLIAVLLGTPVVAMAFQTFDGTYSGTVTRYPQDDLIAVVEADASVSVEGSTVTGTERFIALRSPDYGEYVDVVVAVTQWVEFSGGIEDGGSFSVPGRSFSSWELRSCDGSASSCANVVAPPGNPDGFEVTVTGTIASGTVNAEVVWPGAAQGTYAFTASDPTYAAGELDATTTTSAPPVSTTPQTTIPRSETSDPGSTSVATPVTTLSPPEADEPGARDDGPPAAVVVATALVGAAGAGLAVTVARARRLPRGFAEPTADESIGHGGLPGSAATVIDLLESAGLDRSLVISTWRTEGIRGLDRLAQGAVAASGTLANPVMLERASAARAVLTNPDFAGYQSAPPPETPAPPPPAPPPPPPPGA